MAGSSIDRREPAASLRNGNSGAPVGSLELGKNAGYVAVDGAMADEEPLRDLAIRLPTSDQEQHFTFAVGE